MLVGKIQERYGIRRDEAERQVDEWVARMPAGQGEQQRPQGGGQAVLAEGDLLAQRYWRGLVIDAN